MSTIPSIAYLPSDVPAVSLPLGRFLPVYPQGVVQQWLKNNVPKGNWLVDPLGAHPLLALDATQAGYSVFVGRSNPILRFMLELLAEAPEASDYRSALTAVLATPFGESTLEAHLRSLYETRCNHCNQIVQAKGFIWEKGKNEPHLKVYSCSACNDEGERLLIDSDLDKLRWVQDRGRIHAQRARQRIAIGLSEEFKGFQEGLDCYPIRAIYILITLINKLEGLGLPSLQENIWKALLLTLCDYGNTLWPWPLKPYRPNSLTIPPIYFEHNILLKLEEEVQTWLLSGRNTIVTRYPQIPGNTGGICLYQRQQVNTEFKQSTGAAQGLITIISRPNQAFQTLSAIWTGWLWGHQAVQRMRPALERQRYDWHWLAGSIQAAFKPIKNILAEHAPIFEICPESTPANLFAILAATKDSKLNLKGLAYQPEQQQFQVQWINEPSPVLPTINSLEPIYREIIQESLREYGEPLDFDDIFYRCLILRAGFTDLPEGLSALHIDSLKPDSDLIRQLLQDAFLVKTYKHPTQTQTNLWFPAQIRNLEVPLSERVEEASLNILKEEKIIHLADLEQRIYQLFQGMITPPQSLITASLESYSEPTIEPAGAFRLRKEDESTSRARDFKELSRVLKTIANNLQITTQGDNPIYWVNKKGIRIFAYYLQTNSIINSSVFNDAQLSPSQCVFVIPGSRSNLIHYKLRRNPFLVEQFNQGWHFLKFRYLRKLSHQKSINLQSWVEYLHGDPPVWEPPKQLSIL